MLHRRLVKEDSEIESNVHLFAFVLRVVMERIAYYFLARDRVHEDLMITHKAHRTVVQHRSDMSINCRTSHIPIYRGHILPSTMFVLL